MLKDFAWRTFEYTGGIDNYMLYKEMEHQDSIINSARIAEEEVAISKHSTGKI